MRIKTIGFARSPHALADAIEPDTVVVAMSYGWSFADGIGAICRRYPAEEIDVASWSVAAPEMDAIRAWQPRKLRVLLDYAQQRLRARSILKSVEGEFGEDTVRYWDGHAKMARVDDLAYITSANLNKNLRTESITLFKGGDVSDWIKHIFDEVWDTVPPARRSGKWTRQLLFRSSASWSAEQ